MPSLHHYKSKLRKDFFGDDAGLIGVYVIIHLRFILTDMSYDRILNRLMTPHFVVVVEAAGFFFCWDVVSVGEAMICRCAKIKRFHKMVTTHTLPLYRFSLFGLFILSFYSFSR